METRWLLAGAVLTGILSAGLLAQCPPAPPFVSPPLSEMTFLDNGAIKVGIHVVDPENQGPSPGAWGGTITYIGPSNGIWDDNLVNILGPGRLIDTTFRDANDEYSRNPGCFDIYGWNPSPGGDKYGQPDGVEDWSNDGTTIYTRSIPYQWNPDHYGGGWQDPVPGDLVRESWVTLLDDGGNPPDPLPIIKARYRFAHASADHIHKPKEQEMPFVFVNPTLNAPVTYTGDTFEYTVYYIRSTLEQARSYIYDVLPRPTRRPVRWEFNHDGHHEHWSPLRIVEGPDGPVGGTWKFAWKPGESLPPAIMSPVFMRPADEVDLIRFRMRVSSAGNTARLLWTTTDEPVFNNIDNSYEFPIQSDGEFRTYNISLKGHPFFKQRIITRLALNPVVNATANDEYELDWISAEKSWKLLRSIPWQW